MMDSNNDRFMEDGIQIQGAERGGHFCYKKDDDKLTVEVVGLIQASLMPGTTSLNSGDFPFTFHTHPVVINLDENIIDNYPNLISDEDLIGSIVDNFYCNYPDDRSICNKTQIQQIGGISFFDIVAVPYGLFVYRPNPNYNHTNKSIELVEDECREIFNASITLLPQYKVSSKNQYFNTSTQTAQTRIGKYLNLLRGNGFLVDFFTWSDATNNGIQFVNELPTRSYVDDICMC
jgi:hypothetical protein